MFNITSLFNSTHYFAASNYYPTSYDIASLALNNLNYSLPICALTFAYIFRKRIYSGFSNLAKKYVPSLFAKHIKIHSNNSKINSLLDEEFQRCIASMDKERSYSKKGRSDYEFPATFYGLTKEAEKIPKIHAKDIISQKMSSRSSEEYLKVLDLGTGNGSFVYNLADQYSSKVEAHGISALDTRDDSFKTSKAYPTVKYYEGNVERLFETTPIKRNYYDLLFSSFCFMHLTDPLSSLINAYDALKDGGELYIDHFNIRGLDVDKLRTILSEKGYDFELVGKDGNIDYIHIKKNKPSLDLPIIYNDSLYKTSERIFMQYAWSS